MSCHAPNAVLSAPFWHSFCKCFQASWSWNVLKCLSSFLSLKSSLSKSQIWAHPAPTPLADRPRLGRPGAELLSAHRSVQPVSWILAFERKPENLELNFLGFWFEIGFPQPHQLLAISSATRATLTWLVLAQHGSAWLGTGPALRGREAVEKHSSRRSRCFWRLEAPAPRPNRVLTRHNMDQHGSTYSTCQRNTKQIHNDSKWYINKYTNKSKQLKLIQTDVTTDVPVTTNTFEHAFNVENCLDKKQRGTWEYKESEKRQQTSNFITLSLIFSFAASNFVFSYMLWRVCDVLELLKTGLILQCRICMEQHLQNKIWMRQKLGCTFQIFSKFHRYSKLPVETVSSKWFTVRSRCISTLRRARSQDQWRMKQLEMLST